GQDLPSVVELQSALGNLSLNQRAALLMREVGGLSAKEIGARLGISPGAVATLLFRARRALREELEGPARSPLGGLATLYGLVLRPLWLRLAGTAAESNELLSRSVAAIGVAGAATGVVIVGTSSTPRPAHAELAPRVVAAAPVVHAPRVEHAAPAVRIS